MVRNSRLIFSSIIPFKDEGRQRSLYLSVIFLATDPVTLLALMSRLTVAVMLLVEAATGGIFYIVQVTFNIEARALVDLKKGFRSICKIAQFGIKKIEEDNSNIESGLDFFSDWKTIVASTLLIAWTQTHNCDLQPSIKGHLTLMKVQQSLDNGRARDDNSRDLPIWCSTRPWHALVMGASDEADAKEIPNYDSGLH